MIDKQTLTAILTHKPETPAVICSQIDWRGSVPRRDYPVMLVRADNRCVGTVGGGEMEHQVINSARQVLESGIPMARAVDLSGSEAQGDKAVCGGRTTVLIEPLTEEIIRIYREIDQLETDAVQIITIKTAPTPIVARRLVVANSHDELSGEQERIATEVLAQRKSRLKITGNTTTCYHFLSPVPHLHIFGAGHVAKAVAEMAAFIDLPHSVYDDRRDQASRERFPRAGKIITDPVDRLPQKVNFSSGDLILIATRGHRHDFELMQWLITQSGSYLGLMCSEHKKKALFKALREHGIGDDLLATVHAPVGIDINSETVPEIAVSIIAEIINHYHCGERGRQSLSAGGIR